MKATVSYSLVLQNYINSKQNIMKNNKISKYFTINNMTKQD